jgi:hypothetical protein
MVVATAEQLVRQRVAADLERIGPWRSLAPALRRAVATVQPGRQAQRREAEQRRVALEAKQARVRELYVSDRIDLAAFDQIHEPLVAQIAELDRMIATLPDDGATIAGLRDLATLARQSRDLVRGGDVPTMTTLMNRLDITAHLDSTAPDGMRITYGAEMELILAASPDSLRVL